MAFNRSVKYSYIYIHPGSLYQSIIQAHNLSAQMYSNYVNNPVNAPSIQQKLTSLFYKAGLARVNYIQQLILICCHYCNR